MSKIKTGIIGASTIGEEYVKLSKLKTNNLSLEGIVGRSSTKSQNLAKKYNIRFSGNNINELLKLKLDLLIVAVNISSTIEVAKKLKEFKGMILFEKPLGKNFLETKKIFKFLSNNKKNCFVALNRRSYQNIEMVYNKLKEDNSKKILTVYDQQDLDLVKKAGHPSEVIRNWNYANSIHLIDLLAFLGQSKIVKVISKKNKFKKGYMISSKVLFRNGNIGYYYALWNRPGPWSLNISTSTAHYEFNPIETLKIRSRLNPKKTLIYNEDKKYKPGFHSQIQNLVKIFNLKKSNKSINNLQRNNVLKNIPNIEEYLNLSLIVKKIYKNV